MELTVLVDNNTFVDKYFYGEPAICFYIQDNKRKILFDLGYSKAFAKNAENMDINLHDVDTIVLSHGHNDHTRGILYFDRKYNLSQCRIIAHPLTFCKKELDGKSIGSPMTINELYLNSQPSLSKTPVKISPNITFLGEIPSYNDFEERKVIGKITMVEEEYDDLLMDDSAIVYKNDDGIFIITGCSHSGICNIIEYAKKVCECDKVLGVIGGFHLLENNERVQKTIEYFKQNNIKDIYPCHCVSFAVKAEINKHIPIHEVGVGLKIEL
ncbi:MAG: MBL fold metallo-hydrolase [Oscillospiraceae bacterium]